MHQYQGIALFDYATAAPYVKIDMHPPEDGASKVVFNDDLKKNEKKKFRMEFSSRHINSPVVVTRPAYWLRRRNSFRIKCPMVVAVGAQFSGCPKLITVS